MFCHLKILLFVICLKTWAELVTFEINGFKGRDFFISSTKGSVPHQPNAYTTNMILANLPL